MYASDANKATSYSVTCRQRKVSTGEKQEYVKTSKTILRAEDVKCPDFKNNLADS